LSETLAVIDAPVASFVLLSGPARPRLERPAQTVPPRPAQTVLPLGGEDPYRYGRSGKSPRFVQLRGSALTARGAELGLSYEATWGGLAMGVLLAGSGMQNDRRPLGELETSISGLAEAWGTNRRRASELVQELEATGHASWLRPYSRHREGVLVFNEYSSFAAGGDGDFDVAVIVGAFFDCCDELGLRLEGRAKLLHALTVAEGPDGLLPASKAAAVRRLGLSRGQVDRLYDPDGPAKRALERTPDGAPRVVVYGRVTALGQRRLGTREDLRAPVPLGNGMHASARPNRENVSRAVDNARQRATQQVFFEKEPPMHASARPNARQRATKCTPARDPTGKTSATLLTLKTLPPLIGSLTDAAPRGPEGGREGELRNFENTAGANAVLAALFKANDTPEARQKGFSGFRGKLRDELVTFVNHFSVPEALVPIADGVTNLWSAAEIGRVFMERARQSEQRLSELRSKKLDHAWRFGYKRWDRDEDHERLTLRGLAPDQLEAVWAGRKQGEVDGEHFGDTSVDPRQLDRWLAGEDVRLSFEVEF
jgi:hypothetical protein